MDAGKMALQGDDFKSAETIIEASLCSVQLLSKIIGPDSGDSETEQSSSDYIKCGGLLWSRKNTEADDSKYYTFDEACAHSVPTKEEIDAFIERTYYGFDKKRGVGIFIDRETFARLELPAVGYRRASGALRSAGTYGSYWSSAQSRSDTARNMYFNSSSVGMGSSGSKRGGFSVRCVRR